MTILSKTYSMGLGFIEFLILNTITISPQTRNGDMSFIFRTYIYNEGSFKKKNFFWFVRKMLKGVCLLGTKNGFTKNNIRATKLIHVELLLFFKKTVYFSNNPHHLVWTSPKMIIARKKKMAIIWRLKPDTLLVIHQSLIFDIVSPKVSSVWQYDIQHRTRHGPAFRIPKSLYFQLSSGLSTVASYYYKWWHLIACCAGVSLMGAW